MVGRPGIAPGVSPSQTVRIIYLPHARFYLEDSNRYFRWNKFVFAAFNFSISSFKDWRFEASFSFSHLVTRIRYSVLYFLMSKSFVAATAFIAVISSSVVIIVFMYTTIHIDKNGRSGEFRNLNLLSPKQAVYFWHYTPNKLVSVVGF